MRDTLYLILWTFIAVVSAIDTYFCIKYGEHLLQLERNPIGLWLLQVDGLPILLSVKFLGTSISLGVLFGLRRHWAGMASISGIALFQLLLLLYLCVG
jgi:hypothetical protein